MDKMYSPLSNFVANTWAQWEHNMSENGEESENGQTDIYHHDCTSCAANQGQEQTLNLDH